MVTNSQDYEAMLWLILNNNATEQAILLPTDETIYNIDLSTRKIAAPVFLSVEKDHQAETIYFKFDRYFENVDLVTRSCAIVFTNANKENFIYPVPYYDKTTLASENKVIIPWCIQGAATEKAGEVKFAVKFFSVGADKKLTFELNTLVSTSKILEGQEQDDNTLSGANVSLDSNLLEIIQELQTAKNTGVLSLYWTEA